MFDQVVCPTSPINGLCRIDHIASATAASRLLTPVNFLVRTL
jgi:hypothetical protein